MHYVNPRFISELKLIFNSHITQILLFHIPSFLPQLHCTQRVVPKKHPLNTENLLRQSAWLASNKVKDLLNQNKQQLLTNLDHSDSAAVQEFSLQHYKWKRGWSSHTKFASSQGWWPFAHSPTYPPTQTPSKDWIKDLNLSPKGDFGANGTALHHTTSPWQWSVCSITSCFQHACVHDIH